MHASTYVCVYTITLLVFHLILSNLAAHSCRFPNPDRSFLTENKLRKKERTTTFINGINIWQA
jgi:hypothetical protein